LPRRTAKHAKRAVAESASSLQSVIDSAGELLESIQDQQGAAVEQLREKVSGAAKVARDRLDSLDASELASDAIDDTVGFLRSNPWRSVAIGAIAALAVSLVVRSSSSS